MSAGGESPARCGPAGKAPSGTARGSTAPGGRSGTGPKGAAAPPRTGRSETHSTGHIAEATAQTSTRMACGAADAAERATRAIGSARRRVTAHPEEYALLGVALIMAAAGVALLRRSR
ncbi:hypothetical protein [Actinoplanes regularis]|uniref:hypothetical protein n=1 Tax=Actinoplanes regularis TaxID=52697 RepID=UPI0024A5571E|nr:hypothetical protein [Actinoplanes regularis]GLW34160.1 hypothetical protein Areg01_70970 [Actinoplanes regularis]